MTIEKYEELTETTVSDSRRPIVYRNIRKTQMILENMLGFTLDGSLYNENKYVETGKTTAELPHPDDALTLIAPDSVVGAYRIYNFNYKDAFYPIDPAGEVYKVKIVRDGVTYVTFDTDEYAPVYNRGIIQAIQQHYFIFDDGYEPYFYNHYKDNMHGFQIAVDADWLWSDIDLIPEDLLFVWVDMIDYYADAKKDIKQQTLGSHSYTKFDNNAPETEEHNLDVITRYAGPMGSIGRKSNIIL